MAAETAAALAAASIVFKEDDPTYSATCLEHAKELYQFADEFRGAYHDAITDAASFYRSWSGYNDELGWGAMWLYRATQDEMYLNKAKALGLNVAGEISWDNKASAALILLAVETGDIAYASKAEQFCNMIFNEKPKTTDGRFQNCTSVHRKETDI